MKKSFTIVILAILIILAGCTQTTSEISTPAPAPTPEPELLKVVGQIGGPTQAVAVERGYAYIGVGLRLIVLDVSDPTSPREVGATEPFGWYVGSVTVVGNTAFVAAGGSGLYLVDVSDPTAPAVIGTYDTPGYAESVAVSGHYAYVADGPAGMRVIDIANHARPIEVASACNLKYIFDVKIEGRYAYTAAAGTGLLVTDISDPSKPKEISALDTPGYAYGLTVSESTAYIADGWGGLRVVNVANPMVPEEAGFCDTPGWAFGVAVSSELTYVAHACYGLQVVDVSDTTKPRDLGSLNLGKENTPSLPLSLVVSGTFVYIADHSQGLHIIDISNPTQPILAGLYSPVGYADDIALTGNYACIAAGFYGLRIIDITQPSYPREVGAYNTKGYALSIAVEGDYAYVGTDDGLCIVDISDPSYPRQASCHHLKPGGPIQDLVVSEGIVYLADEWGIHLVDVSNPLVPTELSFLDIGGIVKPVSCTWGISIASGIACVAQESEGLRVVDISDPYNPQPVGQYKSISLGSAVDVLLVGNLAYVCGYNGLQVIDIGDPARPKGKSLYKEYYQASTQNTQRVAMFGEMIFVANGAAGLLVVDTSNLRKLTTAGLASLSGYAFGVAADSDYIYVASGDGGLCILAYSSNTNLAGESLTVRLDSAPPAGKDSDGFANQEKVSAKPLNLQSTHKMAESILLREFSPPPTGADYSIPFSNVSTWVVTSTADSGPGTLRNAVEKADRGDAIIFDPEVFPPKSPAAIHLTSGLFLKQGSITIDASDTGVILDGRNTPLGTNGLNVHSDHNVIKGLQIVQFSGNGMVIGGSYNTIGGHRNQGSHLLGEGNLISGNGRPGVSILGVSLKGTVCGMGNVVVGNLIGTDVSGTRLVSNTEFGVVIGQDASYNRIGGETPAERNVICSDGYSIVNIKCGGNQNSIVGNYIGTDATGQFNLGGARNGVAIELAAFNNTIKGNVISSSGSCVMVYDRGSWCNEIIGNYIGTDASGTKTLSGNGILMGESFNRVGGTEPGERNIIAGNSLKSGVHVGRWGLTDVLVIGNHIGVDTDGKAPIIDSPSLWAGRLLDILPESLYRRIELGTGGVRLAQGSRHCFIGGMTEKERNVISGHYSSGITISGAGTEYNFIAGNYIGMDATGTIFLPNRGYGIRLQEVKNNYIWSNLVSSNNKGSIQAIGSRDNIIFGNNLLDRRKQ